MFLINLLIFLFIILLSYQLFLNFSQNKEGLENMASPTPLPAPTPNPFGAAPGAAQPGIVFPAPAAAPLSPPPMIEAI